MNAHRNPDRGADRGAADATGPAATLEAERQLLEYLDDQRTRRCRRILEQADTEAEEMRRQARRHARLVVREGIRQERSRRAAAIMKERARIEAALRERRFMHQREQLERALELLEVELRRRWLEDATAREEWVRMSCKQALAFLPDGDWQFVHPKGWDRAEVARLLGALQRLRPGVSLSFSEGGQRAGLVLRCGSAVVDTRPDGLLAERARVDGLLLFALAGDTAGELAAGRNEP